LRLGQAHDPADIEPFVRSVTAQRAQMLTAVQIPEHDRAVVAAACETCPVRASLQGLHASLMRLVPVQTFSRPDIPAINPAFTSAADQSLATRIPGNRQDDSAVPDEAVQPFAAGDVPDEQFPARA